jgi:nucleoside-diphosphate-sugar epimerase
MRIVVIGATGHVGGYLVPRLVAAGHEIVAVSRGGKPHYREDPAWERVETVIADREAEDAAGTFGASRASHPMSSSTWCASRRRRRRSSSRRCAAGCGCS